MVAEPEVRIESAEDLRLWLEEKPATWGQVIAVRAALRALPVLATAASSDQLSAEELAEFFFACFRVASMTWTACTSEVPRPGRNAKFSKGISAATREIFRTRVYFQLLDIDNIYFNIISDLGNSIINKGISSKIYSVNSISNSIGLISSSDGDDFFVENLKSGTFSSFRESHHFWWEGVSWDATVLERTSNLGSGRIQYVGTSPLWVRAQPVWVSGLHKRLGETWTQIDKNASVWVNWYDDRLAGVPSFGLSPQSAANLDFRIATQPNDWWARDSREVNADIAAWVAEARSGYVGERPSWDFFLSYSNEDAAAARFVGEIIEQQGFRLFAQYKDMPPGSDFVNEMKRGLAGSARFACILSPDYESSAHCQAEWNAAYRADPTGAKGKMLPFLVRRTELNELAKGFVYVNLVGLPHGERRRLIVEAISRPKSSRAQTRMRAADAVSPTVRLDGRQLMDAVPHPSLDRPIDDADLPFVIDRQIIRTEGLIAAMEGNNSLAILRSELTLYRNELQRDGVTPSLGVLKAAADIIQTAVEEDDTGWVGRRSVFGSLDAFAADHQRLIQFYPLDSERERIFGEAGINVETIVLEDLEREMAVFSISAQEASDRDLITERLKDVVEQSDRLIQQLKTLREVGFARRESDPFTSPNERVSAEIRRKRPLVRIAAFADKVVQVGANVSQVAGSEAGRQLLAAAKKVADAIWHSL